MCLLMVYIFLFLVVGYRDENVRVPHMHLKNVSIGNSGQCKIGRAYVTISKIFEWYNAMQSGGKYVFKTCQYKTSINNHYPVQSVIYKFTPFTKEANVLFASFLCIDLSPNMLLYQH